MFDANINTTFLAAAAAANDPQNSSLICTHTMEEITSHQLDFEGDHFPILTAYAAAAHREASKETTTATTTSACLEALTAVVSQNPFISSHENEIIMTSTNSVDGGCWELPRSSSCAAHHHYIQPNDVKRMEIRDDVGFKIAFRTKSDLEVMDDGYRWRKYGKKKVKNSPNPRNYYRCSTGGCKVKKRVERDREDPRFVITTYEGRHNHQCPSPATPTCHTINALKIPSSHSLQILHQP